MAKRKRGCELFWAFVAFLAGVFVDQWWIYPWWNNIKTPWRAVSLAGISPEARPLFI